MTHAAPVSLAPGDALLPWASTDRHQRRPRQRDSPQVSGMETLLSCSPPALVGWRWGWGGCIGRREHAAVPDPLPGRWAHPGLLPKARMGKEKFGVCACPPRDRPGETGAAVSHGRYVPGKRLRPPQCRERCTGRAVQSSGMCPPPRAPPARGNLVVLLTGKTFKQSQCQTQRWESPSAAAPHRGGCVYPARCNPGSNQPLGFLALVWAEISLSR